MELSKKTTVLFPPDLHERLAQAAARKGISLGELVRTACERELGSVSTEDRIAAVRELGALRLPVGEPGEMKLESFPAPEEMLS